MIDEDIFAPVILETMAGLVWRTDFLHVLRPSEEDDLTPFLLSGATA